jgi:hypothetical protein
MILRPARSDRFPWYDSVWLANYERARRIVQAVRPEMDEEFVDAFRIFRTRSDFEPAVIERAFDDDTMNEIRCVARSLGPVDLELHEIRIFGRFVVHDHPFFTALQQQVAPLVSEAAGEPVEPMYNFLSLYTTHGVCPMHMDSPEAKWTLDLCIDQSGPWPISLSQVCPWPESIAHSRFDDGWDRRVRNSASVDFTSYALSPGQAIVFSGSSQWHYRDAIPPAEPRAFCDLLFFHFVPRGTTELVKPANWARIFGIAELSEAA